MNLKFNQSSPFFDSIQLAYAAQNSSSKYAKMTVRVGYLGMCVDLDEITTCAINSQVDTALSMFTGVELGLSSDSSSESSSSVSLISLARVFSNICHPYTLIVALTFTLVVFLLLFWACIPFLPWKYGVKRATCVLSFANLLVWGLGAMLQEQAINSAQKLVGPSSFQSVVCSKGTRSIGMTWAAFAFILLVFLGSTVTYIQEVKKRAAAAPTPEAIHNHYKGMK